MAQFHDLLIYLALRGMNGGRRMPFPRSVADAGKVEPDRYAAAEELIINLYGTHHPGFSELVSARRDLDPRFKSSSELYTAASRAFLQGEIDIAIDEFRRRGSGPIGQGPQREAMTSPSWQSGESAGSRLLARTPARDRGASVFLCHAKADAPAVKALFDGLKQVGHDPWMDSHKLVLGDDWRNEIRKAVKKADVFVVCLSQGFNETGFRQREVKWARDVWDMRPPGRGFIIPFRLEVCELPDWIAPFHAGGDLTQPSRLEELLAAVAKHGNGRQGSIAA